MISIYQDFKDRLISVILFPLLLVLGLLWYFFIENIGLEIFKNILFLAVLLLGAFVYFSIINRKPTNILTEYLGLGDILFLLAIAPFFGSQNYVLFLISGFLLSLVTHLIMIRIQPSITETIPLAGYLASYLLLLFVLEATLLPDLFIKPILYL